MIGRIVFPDQHLTGLIAMDGLAEANGRGQVGAGGESVRDGVAIDAFAKPPTIR
jgi:hypothetical protein